MTAFVIGFTWFIVLAAAFFTSVPFEDLMLDGISFSAIFLLQAVILGYFLYRMAAVRVSIVDGTIQYKFLHGITRIRPEEISEIQFPSLRYMGGWIKIVAGDKTIRLTVVIEGIGEFLKELKDLLDLTGNSHRYNSTKLFNFLKTATYADQSWARLYSIFGTLVVSVILFGLVGLIFGMVANFHIAILVVLVLSSPILPALIYTFHEAWLLRRFAKATREEAFFCPPRDLVYEKAVFRKSLLSGGLIYGLLLIILI